MGYVHNHVTNLETEMRTIFRSNAHTCVTNVRKSLESVMQDHVSTELELLFIKCLATKETDENRAIEQERSNRFVLVSDVEDVRMSQRLQSKPYDPVVNFRNIMRHLEGKQKRNVPDDVVNRVSAHSRENDIQLKNRVDVRKVLRALNLGRWYRDSAKILYLVRRFHSHRSNKNSEFALCIPQIMLPKLCREFVTFWKEFYRLNKVHRWRKKNFISYQMVIFHILNKKHPDLKIRHELFDFPVSEERVLFNKKIITTVFLYLSW